MAHAVSLMLVAVLGSAAALAQEAVPPEPLTDNSSTGQAMAAETPISPKQFVTNILLDQKPIFTFPWKVVKGRHWKPVAAVALVTAGLVVLDPHTEPFFHDRAAFSSYKTGPLRGRNTTLAITMTPVAFYLAGLVTHSSYDRNTGLLAAEGIIDTQLVSFVMKNAIGRLAPSSIPPNGNYRDTWFKYQGGFTNKGGFPSGHTASAFAVATVISVRYRKHRWVPCVVYGAATLLSLSRLPTQAHFPSDIFLGAAMGYGIGRFVVMKN
jgi:membrane-associated phospholipid phosphatase